MMTPPALLNRRIVFSALLSMLCTLLTLPLTTGVAQATPPATQSAQGASWQVKTTLIPNGWKASTKAYLGWSVAIDGDTLVAGAPAKNNSVGAAEVFVRSGDTWMWQAELLAKDGKANDDFGYAVAISHNSILVGAPYKDNFTGHVYLFQRSGTTWTQQDFPQPKGVKAGDLLGWSVALRSSASPVATSAATGQAKTMMARVNTRTIPSRAARFQITNGNIIAFAFAEPGADQDAGAIYTGFFDEDNNHLSDVIPIIGDGSQSNDFYGAGIGFHQGKKGLTLWSFAPGNTTFGEYFRDKVFLYSMDPRNLNWIPVQIFIGNMITLQKAAIYLGTGLVLDEDEDDFSSVLPASYGASNTQAASPYFIVQSPVNKSNAVIGLELFSFGADGTIKLMDNESPTIGGVMYGYAGATNNTDIALLGVNASKKGSIGFFTIQNGKLVAGVTLPFSQESWQTVNPDGAANFAFSPDGNTLVAATLDAKTKTEAIAVLGHS